MTGQSEEEGFIKYLVKHKAATRREYWIAACKWKSEQLGERNSKMSDLYLACRDLLRYDGIDSDRVRQAVDRIDRIVNEIQMQDEKGEVV